MLTTQNSILEINVVRYSKYLIKNVDVSNKTQIVVEMLRSLQLLNRAGATDYFKNTKQFKYESHQQNHP